MKIYGGNPLANSLLEDMRRLNEVIAMDAFMDAPLGVPYSNDLEPGEVIYFTPKKGKKMNKKQMAVRIERLEKRLDSVNEARASDAISLGKQMSDMAKQVNCAEDDGHDYVFVENLKGHPILTLPVFRYKCKDCGRTVDYTWDELTVKERHALETLGIVQD